MRLSLFIEVLRALGAREEIDDETSERLQNIHCGTETWV